MTQRVTVLWGDREGDREGDRATLARDSAMGVNGSEWGVNWGALGV